MSLPQQSIPKLSSTICEHSELCLLPSTHASEAGYSWPSAQQRRNATSLQKRKREPSGDEAAESEDPTSFPAPLVLPDELLAVDPKQPLQSLRSWSRDKDLNRVTAERRTVYVAAPPDIDDSVPFMRDWINPVKENGGRNVKNIQVPPPKTDDVCDYLAAFYHGSPVKLLQLPELHFTAWEEDETETSKSSKRPKSKPAKPTKPTEPKYIGLNITTDLVGIRTRPCPDGTFKRQLNLNDLLDAVESMLPDDAYALLLLVQHDIYETEHDDFACGRAYGGSRIAVASMARYNPNLDRQEGIDREHMWPASHCKAYMDACVDAASTQSKAGKRAKKSSKPDSSKNPVQKQPGILPSPSPNIPTSSLSPLQAALAAHTSLPPLTILPSPTTLSHLWLSRLCRTASHELAHCFGIEHCGYYACVMQGTCSLAEDMRQPPYLCPVDLAKLVAATGADVDGRDAALLGFCERFGDVHMFRALGAWIRARLGMKGVVRN